MNHFSGKPTNRYQSVSILIVDDEPGMQQILFKALSKTFSKVDCAGSIEEAEKLRKQRHYDLVVLDINLPDRSGTDWHEVFECREHITDVIFMTGYADLDTAVKALKLGAADFILKPFNLEQMLKAVQQCLDKRIESRLKVALQRDVKRHIDSTIIGGSEKTRQIVRTIAQFAPSKASVLIQGESGTGKELIARGLHDASGRSGPFVPVNCGSMSESLLESELFGEFDSVTNNIEAEAREGLFQIADGGTLFLDEISEMPLSVQSALLRVLEERKIRPVGSNRLVNVDIRVVAATNKNIKQVIQEGRFREDLFYRLNVLAIQVPPLRERKTDLIDLVPYFNKKLADELSMPLLEWSEEDILTMHQYEWPGNVRELKNLLERCILIGKPVAKYWRELNFESSRSDSRISVTLSHGAVSTAISDFNNNHMGYPTDWTLKEVEKAHIKQVVKFCDGNKAAAAKELGVSRKTLDRKYKEWECQDRN
ncbi:sigma-54-dependent Fis family transcriptional regulator [Vibrio sp. HA2012]|uniref:sigma-54-dependent transcriptional regulator n=1 Tax=Vibrio sp. HA2012 TaxID=1971595 RepID=UPI000C2C3D07|nr:sigma-54 dependent transcriptional regulator [Vibrio sp. HA2012]PJC87929.1 sigma-54-dependent Fis family transcriptional regulator [Vibrio sp. HA2012]